VPWGGALLAAIGLVACGGGDDGAAPPPPPGAQAQCDALANVAIGSSQTTTASLVAASATMPEYCEVSAKLKGSNVNFVVRLPTTWNGKTRMGAVGGWQGAIAAANGNALGKGYVDYATDSGHVGSGPLGAAFDASWALNDPEALANFASLSYPRVSTAVRQIVRTRYGRDPERNYFEGCSGGGRVALVMAQRHPELFDGIIAGAPGPNYVGVSLQMQRGAKAMAAPGAAFTPGKLQTLATAVRQACDGLDGAQDGIVSNPMACSYDPQVLRCTGADSDSCLTDAQLNVVREVTTDSVLPDGFLLSKGLRLTGYEFEAANWPTWINPIPNSSPSTSLQKEFAGQVIKYVLARDPNADVLAYSPAADAANIKNASALIDAWPGNLSSFGASGGKLIIWNGTGDTPVPFENQVRYLNDAAASLGGAAAAANTVKLYVLPGVNHCGGGIGASTFDWLAALDEWVTANVPPDGKKISHVEAGVETLSRPLCPYPTYPRYNGTGDMNSHSNFTCVQGP
jgi:feruloyl esterase